MATIQYKVNGSYPPFVVELREGTETGAIEQSMVAPSANTDSSFYTFEGVPSGATYYVVAYDNGFGSNSDSKTI